MAIYFKYVEKEGFLMTKHDKFLLVTSFFIMFTSGLMVLLLGSMSPFFMEYAYVSNSQFGTMVGLFSIGSFIATLTSGVIIKKAGCKLALLIVSVLTSLSFILIIFTTNIILLYIISFFIGIGVTGTTIISMVLVSMLDIPFYTAMLQTFYPLGAVVSPIVAILFANIYWKTPFLMCAFFLIVSCVLCFAITLPETKIVSKSSDEKFSSLINKPIVILSCFLLFFYVGTEVSVSNWIVTYLKDIERLSVSKAQFILSLMWCMLIVGRYCGAFISKKVKCSVILITDGILMIVCLVSLIVTSSEISAFAILICFGLSISTVFPSLVLNVSKYTIKNQYVLSVFMACGSAGAFAAPYTIGIISEKFNISVGIKTVVVFAFIYLVITVVNYIVNKKITVS